MRRWRHSIKGRLALLFVGLALAIAAVFLLGMQRLLHNGWLCWQTLLSCLCRLRWKAWPRFCAAKGRCRPKPALMRFTWPPPLWRA